MTAPILYVRPSMFQREERLAAYRAGFDVISNLAYVKMNELVVPRYSVLPFRDDVLREARELACRLATHELAYEPWFWNEEIVPLTPKTWSALVDVPIDCWPCIVKGRINSRKQSWKRLMFAPTPQDGRLITERLLDDPLIAEQGIIYRQWEPFQVIEKREIGPDAINEWRVFTFGGKVIDAGYYWSGIDVPTPPKPEGLEDFVEALAKKVNVTDLDFTCWDVGVREDGALRLIEINDGAMAGLSCIDPYNFYAQLALHVANKG